jgi:pimeloyl-ACP methyl ester carboxylesterase
MRRFFTYLIRGFLAAGAIVLVGIVLVTAYTLSYESKNSASSAPSTGRYVEAGDVRLFVQEAGPAQGPVVLFIHAAGGWSEVWRRTMDELAKQGIRSIAVDIPPLGYSDRPELPAYDRVAQAHRLSKLLDALAVHDVTVVGHSFGARTAAELAFHDSDRVTALVLVDAALALDSVETTSVVSKMLSIRAVRLVVAATTLSNPFFTKTLLDLFVKDPASADDYWVSVYRTPLDVQGTASAVADWLPELLASASDAQSARSKSYEALRIPALVIWGAEDTVTPIEQGRHLAGIIQGSKLVVLPGVGHMPPIEDIGRFNEELLVFLRANAPKHE